MVSSYTDKAFISASVSTATVVLAITLFALGEKEKEVSFYTESPLRVLFSPRIRESGWITTINKEKSECFAGFSLTELSW